LNSWTAFAQPELVADHFCRAAADPRHDRRVTIFLHRCQTHRGLDLHPIASHFFRVWLWLTTGMLTKEWVAIHRKHHAKCETDDDPHSPQRRGLRKVFWEGSELYMAEAAMSRRWPNTAMGRRTIGWKETSIRISLGTGWASWPVST